MDFEKLLEKRTSVKKFTTKKPPNDIIIQAIQAANMAPAPGNINPIFYIVVESPDSINKIADACQQQFIKQAPYVVVVCSELKQLSRLYDKRAEKYLKHFVGASVENFLLKITDLGLASCWVGAFVEDSIRNILSIPENINIEVVLPVGFELGKSKQSFTRPLAFKVYSEAWRNKYKPFAKVRRKDV